MADGVIKILTFKVGWKMNKSNELILVLVTAPDISAARKIATALVDRKLAACVNISPSWNSIYRWEGQVQEDTEVLMLIKARTAHFETHLIPTIQENHPYDLPEIIVLPILDGEKNYLEWVMQETGGE